MGVRVYRNLSYALRLPGRGPVRVIDLEYASPDKYCLPGHSYYFAVGVGGAVSQLADCQSWLTWKGGGGG